MKAPVSQTDLDERRWTKGSYLAAGFALFIFLFTLGTDLISLTWPTDGWLITGDIDSDAPQVLFEKNFLDQPTPLQTGDQLLAINGQPILQLLDAQHTFLRLETPKFPDGTVLKYTLLRQGLRLVVDVPIRKASFWEYLGLYRGAQISQLVQLAGSLFFFIVSVIVFLLRPGNGAAQALLFIGVGFFFNAVPANFSAPVLFYPVAPNSIPFDTWTLAINPGLMFLVLAFPHPKAPLRRFPRLTIFLLFLVWPIAFNTAYLLNLEDRMGYSKAAFSIYPIQIILLMLVTVVALVHSAWKVTDPVGRSQFKWMLAGVFSFVFLGVGGWFASAYLFPESMSGNNWLITTLGWFLLPVCLAIAILRHRLFDIDLIIRRTLVYSLLTALLGLVYFGGVVVLQGVLNIGETTPSGQPSAIVIVITTLAIAALFSPLRRRIQDFIDRRFFRRKYDAQKTLESFAQHSRNATELEKLTAELVKVVEESLQPDLLSLWLKPASRPGALVTGYSTKPDLANIPAVFPQSIASD